MWGVRVRDSSEVGAQPQSSFILPLLLAHSLLAFAFPSFDVIRFSAKPIGGRCMGSEVLFAVSLFLFCWGEFCFPFHHVGCCHDECFLHFSFEPSANPNSAHVICHLVSVSVCVCFVRWDDDSVALFLLSVSAHFE